MVTPDREWWPKAGNTEAERLDCGYRGRLLQLKLLAREIVKAVLDGRGPAPKLPQAMESRPARWCPHGFHLWSRAKG